MHFIFFINKVVAHYLIWKFEFLKSRVTIVRCVQLFSHQEHPWNQEEAWAQSELKKAIDYAGGPYPYPQTQAVKKAVHGENH